VTAPGPSGPDARFRRRNPRLTTGFEDLSAALRACAEGVWFLRAAVELLIGHRFWLSHNDFVGLFVELDARADGTATAFVDWEAAAAALRAGRLPCSDSQGQVLAIAASLAEDIELGLRDAVGGLDESSLVLVAGAVLGAGGCRGTYQVAAGGLGQGRGSW
jgi:hypothetical protein